MPDEDHRRPENDAPARSQADRVQVHSADVSGDAPIVSDNISLSPGGFRARVAQEQEASSLPKAPQTHRPGRPSAEHNAEHERRKSQLEEEAGRLSVRAAELADQAHVL